MDEARTRASTPAVFSAVTSRLPVCASTAERSTLASAPPRTTLVAAMPLAAISVPPPVPPLVPAPDCDLKDAPPEEVTVLTSVAEMSAASSARTDRSSADVTVASVMRAVEPPFTSLNTIRPPKALEDEAGVRLVGVGAP
ncbi:hypothetical protein HPGCJGGD_2568 [Methylobacterium haplocladii]|nr:hypothetical protein HPGCJGGD_2568 [Methylobacterium haplocladii]